MSSAASGRHDAWQAGDSYDGYMGRWSRPIAAKFVAWLNLPPGLSWVELGCGTGALTATVLRVADPLSIVAVDPSEGFLSRARDMVSDSRVRFHHGDADALRAVPTGTCDVAVSGLVLNFVPDRHAALAAMVRVVRGGGTVAFYVWDYPGGGLAFVRAFWNAATALDPSARDLTEARRFSFCEPTALVALAAEAGLVAPECIAIESPSVFVDFEDYWLPFTRGSGPAPGYCSSLAPDALERLRGALQESLPRAPDGAIVLPTRAWAVRGTVG